MKGIIFNQLEGMVTEVLGAEAWDTLLEQSDLVTKEGYFAGPKTYPDEDLFALVATASKITGKPPEELVSAFGRYLFPQLAKSYPVFIKPGMTAKTFLQSVDKVIHVEVRKLHTDTLLPTLEYEDPAPDRLVLVYKSPRKLCDLATGLIDGVGAHFHETITQTQTRCMKRGDDACRIECVFAQA
jgi:hypothetical protein